MNLMKDLPRSVVDLLLSGLTGEFATVNSKGLPIDTPMLIFPSEGLKTLDVCTGLAYPAKAERARNNPKVGLLYEGGPDQPVVSIAGLAAVRDTDIQANTLRYISETAFARPLNPSWSLARKAVYYWSRMLIAITPVRVLWWDRPDEMDKPPQRWDAPADMVYPKSDPKPPGALSATPKWPERSWRELAQSVQKFNLPGHLTLCDADGYPLPIRARSWEITSEGFRLDIPAGAPWRRAGMATLSFLGRETFVGHVRDDGKALLFAVERPLPILPFVNDPKELWEPSPAVYEAVMGRLKSELARRGQPIPVLPEDEPEPTAYAKHRRAKLGGTFESVLPTE
jgi:hypothetical protein